MVLRILLSSSPHISFTSHSDQRFRRPTSTIIITYTLLNESVQGVCALTNCYVLVSRRPWAWPWAWPSTSDRLGVFCVAPQIYLLQRYIYCAHQRGGKDPSTFYSALSSSDNFAMTLNKLRDNDAHQIPQCYAHRLLPTPRPNLCF